MRIATAYDASDGATRRGVAPNVPSYFGPHWKVGGARAARRWSGAGNARNIENGPFYREYGVALRAATLVNT